jgi:ribA/ribD-fused uncharacterized protein
MNYDEEVWSENKYAIVIKGNTAKFRQNQELCSILNSTGNALLVEASPTDVIWGVGLSMDDPRIKDRRQWKGENLLGKALMEVRSWTRLLEDD